MEDCCAVLANRMIGGLGLPTSRAWSWPTSPAAWAMAFTTEHGCPVGRAGGWIKHGVTGVVVSGESLDRSQPHTITRTMLRYTQGQGGRLWSGRSAHRAIIVEAEALDVGVDGDALRLLGRLHLVDLHGWGGV